MAITSEYTLSAEQRETFFALADVLIPAAHDMPAASEAGSVEKWLGRALAARPDLAPALVELLDEARGRDPEAEARRLHAEEPERFAAVDASAAGIASVKLASRKTPIHAHIA